MRKPTYINDLWWTQPGKPFDPHSEFSFSVQPPGMKMEEVGWVLVGQAEVTEIIFDNINPLQAQLAALEAETDRVKAEAQEKLNQLATMKQNLLALPAPSAGDDDDIPF